MFPLEQGAFEMLLIGAIALIVVGPKDLPMLMRKVGQFTAKMRGLAAEFRASFDEMARQSELDDLRREVEALRTGVSSSLSHDPGHDPTFNPTAYGAQGSTDPDVDPPRLEPPTDADHPPSDKSPSILPSAGATSAIDDHGADAQGHLDLGQPSLPGAPMVAPEGDAVAASSQSVPASRSRRKSGSTESPGGAPAPLPVSKKRRTAAVPAPPADEGEG